MNDDEDFVQQLINRRGYLVLGSPIPIPLNVSLDRWLPGVGFTARGFTGERQQQLDARNFYCYERTDVSDMAAQNVLAAELAGAPGYSFPDPDSVFFYRVRTD